MSTFDAVILAGGRARRLGGVDKPALLVGGTSLLDRALASVVGASRIVVVGPPRELATPGVVQLQEQPPGGGPVAALGAALPSVSAPLVVVLGADLPAIDQAGIASLVAASEAGHVDGVIALDQRGREQYLCAAYRSAALAGRFAELGEPQGTSMRALLEGMQLTRVPLGSQASDIDTPEDLP